MKWLATAIGLVLLAWGVVRGLEHVELQSVLPDQYPSGYYPEKNLRTRLLLAGCFTVWGYVINSEPGSARFDPSGFSHGWGFWCRDKTFECGTLQNASGHVCRVAPKRSVPSPLGGEG